MLARKPGLWRISATVLAVATAVNYPWEMLQSRLYEADSGGMPKWLHCLIAGLGDGVFVLIILGAGWAVFSRLDWFIRPGASGYLLMLMSGLALGLAVESISVHLFRRWEYAPNMPLIPGLDIGIVPIAQMLFLPAISFILTRLLLGRQRR